VAIMSLNLAEDIRSR